MDLIRRKFGMLFQDAALFDSMTVYENVAMPLLIRGDDTAKARQRASEILQRVGLGERLGHKPGELSGGERQRAAVARALKESKLSCAIMFVTMEKSSLVLQQAIELGVEGYLLKNSSAAETFWKAATTSTSGPRRS